MIPNHPAGFVRDPRRDGSIDAVSILRVSSPAPRDAWRRVLSESDQSFPFHLPEWLDAACEVGGYEDASRLYEMSDGRTLVLPLARRRNGHAGAGRSASLPPNWGFCGLIGPGSVCADEVAAVVAELASASSRGATVRPGPLAQAAWCAAAPASGTRVRHVVHDLDLEGGFAAVWDDRFRSPLRTAIRKAERAGLEIRRDTSGGLIDTYYALYRTWLHHRADERRLPRPLVRWRGERREPLHRFRAVAAALGDACRTWVASLDGEPVASIVVLAAGSNAIYWRGASDRRLATPTRANDLLMRLAIEEACAEGRRWFHLGESGGVDSLIRWKERFGARPATYEEFRIGGAPPRRAARAFPTIGLRRPRWGE